MRCYPRILNILYKDHATNEEVRSTIITATEDHGEILLLVKVVIITDLGQRQKSA